MQLEEILLIAQLAIMGIAALIGLKLNSRVTVLEAQKNNDETKIKELEGQVEKYRSEMNHSVSSLTMRLLDIENKLIETNTYLKENLRHLTVIVTKHEEKLDKLDDNVRRIERG